MIRWFLFFCVVLFGLAPVAYADDDRPNLESGEQSSVLQIEAELQALRARLGKPGATTAKINELRQRLDELEAKLNVLIQRVDGHDEKIADLQRQIDELKLRIDALEKRVTALENNDRAQDARLDALEKKLDDVLPIGLVLAAGASVRSPIVAGDGTLLSGPVLGIGGAGLEIRFGGKTAGESYVSGTGLGFYEFQKSYGFRAALGMGFLPGPGDRFEIGLLGGGEGHFIQGLDQRIDGHIAYTAGLIVGPHLGVRFGRDNALKLGIDVPIMVGQSRTATSSSRGWMWLETSPTANFTWFPWNPERKKRNGELAAKDQTGTQADQVP